MKMIVDDDVMACERLRDMLGSLGTKLHHIDMETSPRKALRRILQGNYEMVFLDVNMPYLNGIELAKTLRKKGYPGSIVYITGDSDHAIAAIKTEALDYLLKPVIKEELKSALKRFADKSKPQRVDTTYLRELGLTKRQAEIARLLIEGRTSAEIAEQLFLSKHTIDTHRRAILRRTGCKTTGDLYRLL